jgi:hypothetical protein
MVRKKQKHELLASTAGRHGMMDACGVCMELGAPEEGRGRPGATYGRGHRGARRRGRSACEGWTSTASAAPARRASPAGTAARRRTLPGATRRPRGTARRSTARRPRRLVGGAGTAARRGWAAARRRRGGSTPRRRPGPGLQRRRSRGTWAPAEAEGVRWAWRAAAATAPWPPPRSQLLHSPRRRRRTSR